jgi:indolepyruvate ferredoxin oxidoreductase, beta subunit
MTDNYFSGVTHVGSNSATTSVILAGVGGQGVLLISELLARTAIAAAYDAKQTEIHGVSQRGGSVYSHVRFGPRIHSPLIIPGRADVVLGVEKLEALRFASYVKPSGLLIVNDHEIIPPSAGKAATAYPHQAIEHLRSKGLRLVDLPATRLAAELGNVRVANIILLGALSHYLSLPANAWDEVLQQRIPQRYLAINRQAFALGQELGGEYEAIQDVTTHPPGGLGSS